MQIGNGGRSSSTYTSFEKNLLPLESPKIGYSMQQICITDQEGSDEIIGRRNCDGKFLIIWPPFRVNSTCRSFAGWFESQIFHRGFWTGTP